MPMCSDLGKTSMKIAIDYWSALAWWKSTKTVIRAERRNVLGVYTNVASVVRCM